MFPAARHIRRQQLSPQTAIAILEQVWQSDLSGYDPTITQGRVRHGDPKAVATAWRERAEADKLSIRELVIAVTSRQQFVGTVAPLLHERGRFRTEYSGHTLRDHLGI